MERTNMYRIRIYKYLFARIVLYLESVCGERAYIVHDYSHSRDLQENVHK